MSLSPPQAETIIENIHTIQTEIDTEKESIGEQNALDVIDALEDRATEYFKKLDDYDAKHQSMQLSVENWLCESLKFGRNKQLLQSDGIVRYFATYSTLVPFNDIDVRFNSCLGLSFAYNRTKAIKNPDIHLCRIGERLIDELASYIRWDDRGQAFSMWRHVESWSPDEGLEWVGFRFDYVIETDLNFAENILQNWQNANIQAIKRRADALFPPAIKTVFLDTRMNLEEDSQLLDILKCPYRRRGEFRDYSLGSRLEILDDFISRDDWADVCRNTRSQSEILLRKFPEFLAYCQSHFEQAEQDLSDRIHQLELRLERQSGQNTQLKEEVEIESLLRQALLQGIQQPKIRLDSIGFYIVSGRSPSKIAEEEDV